MKKSDLSRRAALKTAAAAASAAPLAQLAFSQAPQQANRGGAARAPRMPQGGQGPIRVLLVTKGHEFSPWDEFFGAFNALGDIITWTHVEQPAAQKFFNPLLANDYDVFVHYDWADRVGFKGGPQDPLPGPSKELNDNFRNLLRQGKGFVFFHHGLAAWNNWPEYKEVQGGAADWGRPITIRGKKYPFSGYRGRVDQVITVVDKTHPITEGLPDTFQITDETYLCPMFEDSVHALLRTNFEPKKENFPQQMQRDPNWDHPPGSNMTAWVKAAENSPIAYIQHGHDQLAWQNENFRKLMGNAIKWAASKDAMTWAKAHSVKIWKS